MSEPPNHFDPLHVEDPCQPANNVGRNVFRIKQIQKAFADAAEAIVTRRAPPLQCLLPSWSPPPPPSPLPPPHHLLPRSNSVQLMASQNLF